MKSVLEVLKREAGNFYEEVGDCDVTPTVTPEEIRHHLESRYSFRSSLPAAALIADVTLMLRGWTLHVTHPRYFGLFNPSVLPITVAADALTAVFNPQLAVWLHSPAANEIERHVLRFLASHIGFDPDASVAHFTTGGQEANLTSVLAAMAHHFPETGDKGLRCLPGQPTLYVSEEAHHSFHKISVSTGLGREAVRVIPTDQAFRMDTSALEQQVVLDARAGLLPFMVVATAGTTSAGVVDPLMELARLSSRLGLWLHVDAAWGGAAVLSPLLRPSLGGIERADSVTWDAHKWLSVPMGAGMFFCRRPEALARAFRVSASNYVPAGQEGTTDNYLSTVQWSRRFIGLKVFMALAEQGVGGYQKLIEHQVEMAELLRKELAASGWRILNDTPLPLVCFVHPSMDAGTASTTGVVRRVNQRRRCWISEVSLPGGARALRACMTSYRVMPADIAILVADLQEAIGAR